MLQLLTASDWKDYELIDSGHFEKLERFGQYILIRPEPQAIWDSNLPDNEWERLAHAVFRREKGNAEKGEWAVKKGMPEQWWISYQYKEMELRFRLGLTAFKHVGVFPEQAQNWNYLYDQIGKFSHKPKILNLFAYTGGASLAAKAAGADVIHLDSVRQVVSWSRENMEASKLSDIRWLVEDAIKFVRKEAKRGNRYEGIILDPPAYGRGPEGEKWILEEGINELLKLCHQLLNPSQHLLILNLYSMGFSPLIADGLVTSIFGQQHKRELGELYMPDKIGRKLPLGIFLRFSKI